MYQSPVCVLPGKWSCDDGGVWNFVLTKGMMARFINITPEMSLEELIEFAITAFSIDTHCNRPQLSFWCSDVSDVLTQTRLPPVLLVSDTDFAQFKYNIERNKCMNIFLTIVDTDEVRNVGDGVDDTDFTEQIGNDQTMLQLLESVETAHRMNSGKQITEMSDGVDHAEILGRGEPTPLELVAGEVETEMNNGVSSTPSSIYGSPGGNLTTRLVTQLSPIGFNLGIPEVEFEGCSNPDEVIDPVVEADGIFNDPPPDLDYLPGSEDDDSFYIGRTFSNKDMLKNALALYALRTFFNYRITKSDRTRLIAECVEPRCGWRIYAVGYIDSESFVIRTRSWEHTCSINARATYGKKATPKVLGEIMHGRYANGKNGPRACDIPDILITDMNVDISYRRAWLVKEVALEKAWGRGEDNYKLLTTYLRALTQSNPGTRTNISTISDEFGNTHFKYLFTALGASVHGYQFMRKVIVIDGTQLKGKYKGCLVAASCQDGNMQIYPIAFGVLDSENDDAWCWFLENLKEFVDDQENLLFVSDRHQSINAAIRRVYPRSHHAYCIVHLFRNVKQRFKCSGLASTVSRAARAYTEVEFQYEWMEIQRKSPACADYLQKIGFPHWTRFHCPVPRYNLMSSNISESLNAAIQKAVGYPIITMLEFIRTMMMRWFTSRREKAARCFTHCTPEVESILVENMKLSNSFKIMAASYYVYQVHDGAGNLFTVDLKNKSCSCLAFETLGIPCPHATAARKVKGINIYSLVDAYYGTTFWEFVYEKIIMPVPQSGLDESTPGDSLDHDLLPPFTKRPPGRPKRSRIPSVGEVHNDGPFKAPRCGRCFQSGHNRKTCKNSI